VRHQRSALLASSFTDALHKAYFHPLEVIPGLTIAYGALRMEYGVQLDSLHPLFCNAGQIEACVLNAALKRLATDANNRPDSPPRVLFSTEFYTAWLHSNNPAALLRTASRTHARKGLWIFALHIGSSLERTKRAPDHYVTAAIDWDNTSVLLADSCERIYSPFHPEIYSAFQSMLSSLGMTTEWRRATVCCPQQVLLDCGVHMLLEIAKLTRPDLFWSDAQPSRARTSLGVLMLSVSSIEVNDRPPPPPAPPPEPAPLHLPGHIARRR